MRFNLKETLRNIKKPIGEHGLVLPSLGITTGLIAGGFLSEMTAKTLGKVGYVKAGVKTAVKVALGSLFFGTGIGIPTTNVLMYPAALAILGTIPLDWIAAKWPGGVEGSLAERAAVVVRKWSMGTELVKTEIANVEGAVVVSGKTVVESGKTVHVENSHTVGQSELVGAPLSKNSTLAPARPSMVLRKSFV